MKSLKLIFCTLIMAALVMTGFTNSYATQTSKDSEAPAIPAADEVADVVADDMAEDSAKRISQEVEQEPLKYTIGMDDVIQIDVRRHPEFSGQHTINSEGKIQYKFVGDIPISGFTKTEVKEKLKNILSKYIIEPDIEVTILQYRSKVIFIVGEVGAPGKYYMRADSVSVRDAVVQAGLPTLAASMRKTRLIHPTTDGKPSYEKLDLYKLLYEGKLDIDKVMLPGDILYVPATIFAKIGRMLNPVAAPISPATTIERAATPGGLLY